jgi:hypothetical protein
MTKSFALGAALALAALAAAAPARALDPWEGGTLSDDSVATRNTLSPGLVQQHDLDQAGGGNDVDWAVVPTLQFHSYEARVSGSGASFDWGICATCAQFERVDAATGTILTEDVATVNDGPGTAPEAYDRSVRWLASGSTIQERVRVTGGSATEDTGSVYTLRYWDTTYTVPRWNSVGGQTTVFVITSLVQGTVTGNVYFFSGTGALLHTQPLSLSQNVPFVLSTSTVGPLAGQSGYALVAHNAGYGGLTGKAVALEPQTGFTFDTALQPIPQ